MKLNKNTQISCFIEHGDNNQTFHVIKIKNLNKSISKCFTNPLNLYSSEINDRLEIKEPLDTRSISIYLTILSKESTCNSIILSILNYFNILLLKNTYNYFVKDSLGEKIITQYMLQYDGVDISVLYSCFIIPLPEDIKKKTQIILATYNKYFKILQYLFMSKRKNDSDKIEVCGECCKLKSFVLKPNKPSAILILFHKIFCNVPNKVKFESKAEKNIHEFVVLKNKLKNMNDIYNNSITYYSSKMLNDILKINL